jgi:predicted phosphoribosyltransferase
MQRFANRREAGRQLAQKLLVYADRADILILALPRGGVPVAYEVAATLNVPLDVLIVRKLGLPGREELAIGAIASGGIQIINKSIVQAMKIDPSVINSVVAREIAELQRREQQYRGNRPAQDVRDRTVILIDDGLATGASMFAAIRALRSQHPARTIIAVPAAAPQAIDALKPEVDEIVFVIAPDPFEGVGKWYENFSQTTDEEVRLLLDKADRQLPH